MNRSKLTPCRKVGLSRKRNTPLKTIEGLLNKKENIVTETPSISDIQSSKKTATPNPIAKGEVNNETPCRQVGLSRKKKTNFEFNKNLCTPSPLHNRVRKEKPCKVEDNSQTNHIELISSQSLDNKQIVAKNDETSKTFESNEENHVSCAKKLSNLFSTPNAKTKENEVNNLQDTQYSEENKKTVSDVEKVSSAKNMSLKSVSDNIKNIEVNEHLRIDSSISIIDKEVVQKKKKLFQNNTKELNQTNHCDKYKSYNTEFAADVSPEIVTRNDENSIIISQKDESKFIKVCYSDKKEYEKAQSIDSKPKKSKFSRELFDDDFEIGPKQKKPKKNFERSKTDVIKKEKKSNKNKLKKSLSVGDPRSRTLTDNSITSNTSSLNSLNNCFVKLEQIKESPDEQIMRLTPQDQSDDDFETFTCTPKETKIKNLDSLEKEVEEKRQILEELKRAKMHKKMHGIEDLKELTARWKTGCVDALQDLLKQLNTHSQMTMEMLVKKLNIPENVVPLSQ